MSEPVDTSVFGAFMQLLAIKRRPNRKWRSQELGAQNKIEIRYIKDTDDRFAISRIYEESWRFAYKDIVPKSYLDSIPSGKWAAHLDNTDMHTLVALENNKLMGTASYCKSRFCDFADFGEIVSIYFLPEYMGQGYGTKLLKVVVDELAKLGYHDIFLWVLEANTRARVFYEKAGFIFSNKFLVDNIGGQELREVQYCCHIE